MTKDLSEITNEEFLAFLHFIADELKKLEDKERRTASCES